MNTYKSEWTGNDIDEAVGRVKRLKFERQFADDYAKILSVVDREDGNFVANFTEFADTVPNNIPRISRGITIVDETSAIAGVKFKHTFTLMNRTWIVIDGKEEPYVYASDVDPINSNMLLKIGNRYYSITDFTYNGQYIESVRYVSGSTTPASVTFTPAGEEAITDDRVVRVW